MRARQIGMAGGLGVLIGLLLVSGLAQAGSTDEPVTPPHYRIELLESAQVSTETIQLSDVAQVESIGSATDGLEELQQLAGVDVGRVPLVGQTVRIPAGYIPVKLRQARISLDRVTIEFPPSGWIAVTRVGTSRGGTTSAATTLPATKVTPASAGGSPSVEVTAEDIRDADTWEEDAWQEDAQQALVATIQARAEQQGRPAGARWQVSIQQLIGLDRIRWSSAAEDDGKPDWVWDLGSWIPMPGRFILFARLQPRSAAGMSEGEGPYPVTIYGELLVTIEVIAARSQLPAGKLLGPEDIELRLVESSSVATLQGTLTRPEDAIGRQLQRAVAQGEPLRDSLLSAPLVVRRGDRFTAELRTGWVSVTVLLEAMEDGRTGSLIRSRNVDTGQVVRARVTPDGPVVVVDVATALAGATN